MSASVHKMVISRVKSLYPYWSITEDDGRDLALTASHHQTFQSAFKELYTRVQSRGWKPQAACAAPNGGMVLWAEE
jgi:hypothetical protein